MILEEAGTRLTPWPAGMPSGWAHTVSGTGHYSETVAAWPTLPDYFKVPLMRPIPPWEVSIAYFAGVQDYMNAFFPLFTAVPAGGFYANIESKGQFVGKAIYVSNSGTGISSGGTLHTMLHEWGHHVDAHWSSFFPSLEMGSNGHLTGGAFIKNHYDTQISPALAASSLYAKVNILEWFAEFFTYLMRGDIPMAITVCENSTTAGSRYNVARTWFDTTFPGWAGGGLPAVYLYVNSFPVTNLSTEAFGWTQSNYSQVIFEPTEARARTGLKSLAIGTVGTNALAGTQRVLPGFVIGQQYRFEAYVSANYSGNVLVGIVGLTFATVAVTTSPDNAATWVQVQYTFTATAVSHTLEVRSTVPGSLSRFFVDDVYVLRTSP